MDRHAALGLLATAGLLAGVVVFGAGSEAHVFWRAPSLALVVGGAVLTTLVAYPGVGIRSLARVVGRALCERPSSPDGLIMTVVALAEIARREGLLALERPVDGLNDGFLRRAMQMAIDGYDPETIRSVMLTELEGIDQRHTRGKGMLESIGRSAPVFGMIGTLVGLVLMLGQMNDPTKIGPGMAVALLTTLYGLVLANVFCLPLARRLGERGAEELLHKTMALTGVIAIQSGDHPRVVAQKLQAYLPAGQSSPDAVSRPGGRSQPAAERQRAEDPAGVAAGAPASQYGRFVEAA